MTEQGPARESGTAAGAARIEGVPTQQVRGQDGSSPGQPVTTPMAGEERRVVSERPAFVPGTPDPVLAAVQGSGLVLEFQPRATRLDDASSATLSSTLATEGNLRDAPLLEVRAAVNRSAAGLSDARRIAFYRAMLVRSAILKSGIPPERVRVLIDETDNPTGDMSAERVRVIALR
jgi:hypothetical protein